VTKTELAYNEEIVIPWGNTEVRGRVAEVFGPPAQRRVVVALEPELSSYVVAEPTTVALPIGGIRKVIPAPKPVTLDAESDAVLTYGANALGVGREKFLADAIHQLAAAHGIEVEEAMRAAAESIQETPRADSRPRARRRRGAP